MTSIKQQLDTMLKRSLTLCGYTLEADAQGKLVHVPKDEAVKNFLKTLASESIDMKDLRDKIVAAWDDPKGEIAKSLNAARVTTVSNYIAAESTFKSAFFTTETLGDADEPFYTNETKNEVRISTLGEDGSPEHVRLLNPYARANVGLYLLTSDWVRWKTRDIYRGDVSATIQNTIDIARDMRFKLDRVHYDMLNLAVASGGCFGAFSYEQARSNKAQRIYLSHSGIVTAHLPTTNAVVNGTTGGPGGTRFTVRFYDPVYAADGTTPSAYNGFRPAVLMSIIDYADSWGDALPAGGRLVPTGEIIVPASDVIDIATYMSPTNVDKVQTRIQEDIINNGYTSLSLLGRNWRFIPDVTIPVNTCYPVFNLKPGLSYEKPSWNKEQSRRDDDENWEERRQQALYGAVIPSQWRPRAMKITYA